MKTVLLIEDSKNLKRNERKTVSLLILVICLFAAGCTSPIPPQIKFDQPPYEPIINAEVLTIEVISINDALRSESVIENAVNYYRPYVTGEIKILDCNHLHLDLGDNNAISRQQLEQMIYSIKTYGPTRITIVICPDMDFFSSKGFYGFEALLDKPERIRHYIAINAKTCNKHASSIPFVTSEKLTTLVILHELCHALQVPARKEHQINGNEGHCSNPDCILYPRIDCHSAFSAILHLGPPTKLCKQCREEVFAVQKDKALKEDQPISLK